VFDKLNLASVKRGEF